MGVTALHTSLDDFDVQFVAETVGTNLFMRWSPGLVTVNLFSFDHAEIVIVDSNRVRGDGDLCGPPNRVEIGKINLGPGSVGGGRP